MGIVKDVKDLISQAKTEKAISKLKEFTKDKNGEISDAILLIETNFKVFNQQKIIGELTVEQERTQVIRINNQIISLLNEYVNDDDSLKVATNRPKHVSNNNQITIKNNILKNFFLPIILSLIFSSITVSQYNFQFSESDKKVEALILPFLFIFITLYFLFFAILGLINSEPAISCGVIAMNVVLILVLFISYKKGFPPSVITVDIIKNIWNLK